MKTQDLTKYFLEQAMESMLQDPDYNAEALVFAAKSYYKHCENYKNRYN